MPRTPVVPPLVPFRHCEPKSISVLLPGVLAGNQEAIGRLWSRFSPRLIALAQSRLGRNLRQPVDGEDVALKAFADFVHLMGQRDATTRFNELENRQQLWRVLARITVWEALDWVQPPTRPEMNGGEGLEQVPGREPEPDFDAAIQEGVEHLIDMLVGTNPAQTNRLRQLARLKMQGCKNEDAARHLKCSKSQVELLLQHIRKVWHEYDPRPESYRNPSGE